MWRTKCAVYCLAIACLPTLPLHAQEQSDAKSSGPVVSRRHLADYDAELRRADGRVDVDAMVARLKELGVTTYYWLIWHAATDWDDLKLFLPKAAAAEIQVWVYLVPPSESPPAYGQWYSEPFRLDYLRWAEEIARLGLAHPNLTGWVIDDFYANHEFFTPEYVGQMRERSRAINPRLAFLPLMYIDDLRPETVEAYRGAVDGMVVAYLQDREEIEYTWALLNDADVPAASEFSYPWNVPSRPGDFAAASRTVRVAPGERYEIRFRERDDFSGPTAGYHFKQLLVDGQVVWVQDVAGGEPGWSEVAVDVTEQVRGNREVTLALRMIDKQGVSNFGVRWRIDRLRAEQLAAGDELGTADRWQMTRQGAFDAGFGPRAHAAGRRFHIPFISMPAGNEQEFGERHGGTVTPERVAAHTRLSLEAWRAGKCDGVVTYCLDKSPESRTFGPVQKLFREYSEAQ